MEGKVEKEGDDEVPTFPWPGGCSPQDVSGGVVNMGMDVESGHVGGEGVDRSHSVRGVRSKENLDPQLDGFVMDDDDDPEDDKDIIALNGLNEKNTGTIVLNEPTEDIDNKSVLNESTNDNDGISPKEPTKSKNRRGENAVNSIPEYTITASDHSNKVTVKTMEAVCPDEIVEKKQMGFEVHVSRNEGMSWGEATLSQTGKLVGRLVRKPMQELSRLFRI